MRQIKFRGKRKDNGEWIYGDYCSLPNSNIVFVNKQNEIDTESIIPDTVSQFTGLVDRNGKEVYENDIVSFPVKHKNLLVEWNDDLCVYQFSDGSLINSGDNYSEIIFIVGNAFDNPELLNEKQ